MNSKEFFVILKNYKELVRIRRRRDVKAAPARFPCLSVLLRILTLSVDLLRCNQADEFQEINQNFRN